MSSPLIPGCSINYCPLPNITPAIADCRYRAPLPPRLHGNFKTYLIGCAQDAPQATLYLTCRPPSSILRFSLSQVAKKALHHLTAFILPHTTYNLNLMIELFHVQQVYYGARTSGLGIHTSYHHIWDTGLHYGPGTHLARFKGHIHCALLQPPVAELL